MLLAIKNEIVINYCDCMATISQITGHDFMIGLKLKSLCNVVVAEVAQVQ